MKSMKTVRVTVAALILLIAGFAAQAVADPSSFTLTGDVPAQVDEGVTFYLPATVTDSGAPAADYHVFFQIYDENFLYITQTYYDDQTFDSGQTLDYDVPLVAPTTPGEYYVAGLVFDKNYDDGIVSQAFLSPTFDDVPPAPVPEPSYGLSAGFGLLGALVLTSWVRSRRGRGARVVL